MNLIYSRKSRWVSIYLSIYLLSIHLSIHLFIIYLFVVYLCIYLSAAEILVLCQYLCSEFIFTILF